MMTFKNFIDDPVNAVSYGYEAWLIDYWALWCHRISFRVVKLCLIEWKELFTRYSMVEFPIEFIKVLLGTLVFLSIPILFPLYGLISFLLIHKLVKERKENRLRAMRDL